MYLWDTLQGVLQVCWIVLRINITPPHVKIYVIDPNIFLGYLERGIACYWVFLGMNNTPTNTLNQNNSAHGVYDVAQ